MNNLRFAVFGAGFWARYQLAAWREVGGVECAAIYNRSRPKAEALAAEFGIPAVYDQAEVLLDTEHAGEKRLDFIDIVTDVDTHPKFTQMAISRRIPVICQKPMAPTLAEAEQMTLSAQAAGVPFFVHENWRWQAPLRALKDKLDAHTIGTPFRARIDMISGFPVFDNQPFFRDLKQFLLMDLGSHILDVARFLFGEADTLYCRTQRVHSDIQGEDVATVILGMANGMTVMCSMAYAGTPLEHDRFPETKVFIEADKGSLALELDYQVRETTAAGTVSQRVPPPRFLWADPAYDIVQASIVPCCADLLAALRGDHSAETTGEDNLKTVRLVFSAYQSAAAGTVARLGDAPQ